MLSSNMLLLNLILLIDVTFSTPTGDYANYDPKSLLQGRGVLRSCECYGDVSTVIDQQRASTCTH